MRRRASKLLALVAFLLFVPGTAHALTVSYDPAFQPDDSNPATFTAMIVVGAPGEVNQVRQDVPDPGKVFDLYSGNQTILFGANIPGDCSYLNRGNAGDLVCTSTVPQLLIVSLGDQDDRWDGNTMGPDSIVLGGTGNDRLRTGGGSDLVVGEDGNDILSGGPGNDTLDGGAGDDDLENYDDASADNDYRQAGEDDLVGGPGIDRANFSGRTVGVTVTLDDVANDGSAIDNVKDNVGSDVENVLGSRSNDTITGTAGPNLLDGYFGNDTIDSGAGDDKVDGGSDNDNLKGGPGVDLVEGGEGNDVVEGGAGTDTLYGDYPCSLALCDNGADTIQARDGEIDTISCGFGADSAVVDYNDVVAADGAGTCETLDRSAAPLATGPGGGTTTPTAAPVKPVTPVSPSLPVTIPASAKASAFKAGVSVKVTVASAASCTATLTVKKKAYATAKGSTKKAGTVTLKLKAKKGKSVKKGAGSVAIICTPKTGTKVTVTKPLTVK